MMLSASRGPALTRRTLLRLLVTATGGSLAAACSPPAPTAAPTAAPPNTAVSLTSVAVPATASTTDAKPKAGAVRCARVRLASR